MEQTKTTICPLREASSEQLAWVDQENSWTYREMDAWADRWTAYLLQQGIKAGSRIAVLHQTSPHLAALFFAAWRLQAAVCPLNLRLPQMAIERFLESFKPDLYIKDLSPDNLKTKTNGPFAATIHPDLPALFMMTSGSTAEPKLAVLSLANLLANAEGSLALLDLKPNDRWLLNLPLFHVSGIGILLRCTLAQAAIAANDKDPRITHLSCVPTQLYRASPVYKNLRCLLLGGAPIHSCPAYLPIVVTYGLTEMGSMVLAKKHTPDGYLGFALPKREIKLAEDGELLVRGPCLFMGYWQKGTIQKPDEWFATKDMAICDPLRGIKITGRKDWQFISGGENIQPEEIEKFLLSIESVEEAAVLPCKDPEFGARPVAFIVGSVNAEKIKKELVKHLPKYKIPKHFLFLKEIPKKGFKIDRTTLFNFLENKGFTIN